MRKIIAFSFVLSLFCSVYAEKITGFMDIKFGCSPQVVENRMKELGYKLDSTNIPYPGFIQYLYSSTDKSFYFLGKKVYLFLFAFREIGGLHCYILGIADVDIGFLNSLTNYNSDLKVIEIDKEKYKVTLYDPENDNFLISRLEENDGVIWCYLSYSDTINISN